MAIKVAFDLNKDVQSPFKDKIRMLDMGDQVITLKGFVGYDLKGLLGKTGLLRNYHTNVSKEYVSFLKDYLAIKKNSGDDDWKIESLKSKYVGSQGWKEFHRDL